LEAEKSHSRPSISWKTRKSVISPKASVPGEPLVQVLEVNGWRPWIPDVHGQVKVVFLFQNREKEGETLKNNAFAALWLSLNAAKLAPKINTHS
jgi:hypothetical protein